ncbi:bifunctional DNA primase/polymerase [Peterkaempfera bronchialis]|uniref:DNA primase n=1 Tax=Peterkaempfera bronchialis TaxID=2126346 RepID=A0A345SYB2_9ACTN|nr:bifunctional DNA primase/polymerase [Peterkaempfera bronchialis]AXI78717.1 DNA primase [Peterkaempfera bronchialis]
MREILGRRRRNRSALLAAALTCAEQWRWPVVPGAGLQPRPFRDRFGDRTEDGGDGGSRRTDRRRSARACVCPRSDCAVPGAHPCDPPLLAATTDPRMVRWWWTQRPDAPIVIATGGAVAAVSLPAASGARVLAYFDALRVRTGPVVASATRHVLLVQPYSFDELGELLIQQEWVPTSLRYHGPGGYVVLPPSSTGGGGVHWERPPVTGPGAPGGAPWLPRVADLLGALVAASAATPDGSRLAF